MSDSPAANKSPLAGLLALGADAWKTEALTDKSPRGRLLALIRIVTTTIQGVLQNKIPLQAAGLTYYTLMSLGPMLILALTLGGFIINKQEGGHEKFKQQISGLIQQIAPQTTVAPAGATNATDPAPTAPKFEFLDNILNEAASGGASVFGVGVLIVLAVLMLSRVENAYNSIWNVHKGRPWKDRFINYFLFMVVSCIFGSASLTMLSGSSIAKGLDELPKWMQELPGLTSFLTGFGPTLISLVLMTVLVALFNRYMPKAKVRWIPALLGGLFVAVVLITNQKLGALYAGKVAGLNKLYGSLSFILVLMFGMYLSWLFLLIGGQFTFAVQNSRSLAAYKTWESLSARTKQTLCFGCLIRVGRRFRAMEIAPDAEEMAAMLHVPRSIIEQCMFRLLELGLVVAVDDGDDVMENDRYRPNFPLEALTVAQIKDRLESYNGGIAIDPKIHTDGALARFDSTFGRFGEIEDARLTFDALLAQTER